MTGVNTADSRGETPAIRAMRIFVLRPCERSIMQFRDQTTALTLLKQLRDFNSVRGTQAMVAVGRTIIFGASRPDRGAAVQFLP